MKYRVTYTDKADKILQKMDLQIQARIYDWINKNLEGKVFSQIQEHNGYLHSHIMLIRHSRSS